MKGVTLYLMSLITIQNLHLHVAIENAAEILKSLKLITMTQQEALDKLKALATQLSKVKSEVTKLAEAAQNSGNVSPELEAAINAVTGAVKEIDDLNADEVPETPAEPEV